MTELDVAQDLKNESGQLATLGSESILSAVSSVFTTDFTWFLGMIGTLWILRVILLKILLNLSRSQLADNFRITRKPAITGAQLERESVWKYGYIWDTLAFIAVYYQGLFKNLPLFDWRAIFVMIVAHATIVEFVYYWFHRALHVSWLYKNYHQYHHKSIATEPTTGLSFEIGERLAYTILFAVSPILSTILGYQSLITMALYFLAFDFLNEGGHINFEVAPDWYHSSFLRYILYTPSYHATHHTKFKKNYSLFMPWTDIIFYTAVYEVDPKKPILPISNTNQQSDFILLVHAGYIGSAFYSRLVHPIRGLGNLFTQIFGAKNKFEQKPWMYIFYPYILSYLLYLNLFQAVGFHNEESFELKPRVNPDKDVTYNNKTTFKGATWIVHNLAATYLFPSFKNLINDRIENAILEAKRQNVRVVVLGNFNKAEWMNHGGSDIVKKLGDKLNGIYISHGDTLSAAVIYQYSLALREKGYWKKSVFVTGSTSKIGRAVCLSLAKHGIPVKMFTQCKPRFDEIAAELSDPLARSCLQFVSTLKEGADCDLWLTGKMIPSGKELLTAIPDDATVVNFSVPDPLTPELLALRPDLLHLDSGLLAYDKKVMSPEFTWLLPDGHLYACLAGGLVHSVLGFNKHEVGAVEIDEMDLYWKAALRIGFRIPDPSSFYNPVTMPAPKHLQICEV